MQETRNIVIWLLLQHLFYFVAHDHSIMSTVTITCTVFDLVGHCDGHTVVEAIKLLLFQRLNDIRILEDADNGWDISAYYITP